MKLAVASQPHALHTGFTGCNSLREEGIKLLSSSPHHSNNTIRHSAGTLKNPTQSKRNNTRRCRDLSLLQSRIIAKRRKDNKPVREQKIYTYFTLTYSSPLTPVCRNKSKAVVQPWSIVKYVVSPAKYPPAGYCMERVGQQQQDHYHWRQHEHYHLSCRGIPHI